MLIIFLIYKHICLFYAIYICNQKNQYSIFTLNILINTGKIGCLMLAKTQSIIYVLIVDYSESLETA